MHRGQPGHAVSSKTVHVYSSTHWHRQLHERAGHRCWNNSAAGQHGKWTTRAPGPTGRAQAWHRRPAWLTTSPGTTESYTRLALQTLLTQAAQPYTLQSVQRPRTATHSIGPYGMRRPCTRRGYRASKPLNGRPASYAVVMLVTPAMLNAFAPWVLPRGPSATACGLHSATARPHQEEQRRPQWTFQQRHHLHRSTAAYGSTTKYR